MKDLLLIDGYNIIHSWPELRHLLKAVDYETARMKLIDIICDYSAHSNFETILVFDAHMKKGRLRSMESHPPIKVIYTAEHETADQYIEKAMNAHDTRRRNVYVATSDALEQTIIFGRGGARLSSRELLRMVNQSKGDQKQTMGKLEAEGRTTIAGSLNEQTLERLDGIIKNIRLEE